MFLETTASNINIPLIPNINSTCDTNDNNLFTTTLFNNILGNFNFNQNKKLNFKDTQSAFNCLNYMLKAENTSDGESSPQSWLFFYIFNLIFLLNLI